MTESIWPAFITLPLRRPISSAHEAGLIHQHRPQPLVAQAFGRPRRREYASDRVRFAARAPTRADSLARLKPRERAPVRILLSDTGAV